jgi:hypothetical protein
VTTNIEIEAQIRQRARDYTAAAQRDIDTLLTESVRLRDAVAEEYELRVAAEGCSARQLVEATRAKAKIHELSAIINQQNNELDEQRATIKWLLQGPDAKP